jgi:membrane protein implicated in regulation of membrane protease activity
VAAVIGGLAVSGLMYLFYSQFLIRSQGSSEVRQSDVIGLHAEVTVPIGENSPGQVSYQAKSGRMRSMAQSADGQPIPRGQFVRIVRIIGRQVLVAPLSADDDNES